MQRLLPVLSTYLGHSKLRRTQVYLSITPELLQQHRCASNNTQREGAMSETQTSAVNRR